MSDKTIPGLKMLRKMFLSIKTIPEFSELLSVPPSSLAAIAARPKYNSFFVPKKNGEKRLIEDPDENIKPIHDILNDFLQAVYWHIRPESVYGFLVVPVGDPSVRNIEENARKHIGKPYLLNCDLDDFFHQITTEMVEKIFLIEPFLFDAKFAGLLAKLTTYNGRCPMGAPTSPVLSNLAFRKADDRISKFARRNGWIYTRYADDLSFSGHRPFTPDDYAKIQEICSNFGFIFNPEKLKIFGPEDDKIITGLQLTETNIQVPDDFIPNLMEGIVQLKGAVAVQFRTRSEETASILKFKQSIEGKIRFMERIMGPANKEVQKIWKEYKAAIYPPDELQAVSWLDFDYF